MKNIELKRLNPVDRDALVSKISFYEKNGFKILVKPAENDETVLMYYDLKKFEVIC